MVRQIFVWLLLIVIQCSNVFSQQIINLNADEAPIPFPRTGGIKSGEQETQGSRRYRELNLNPELQRSDHITARDTILLDLFSNRKYKAVVEKINRDINGTLVIRAKLAGYKYSYCTISTNDQKSLMILDIPETEEYYKMNYDQGTNRHYLLDLDKTKIKYLEGAPSVIPPSDNRDPGRINLDDRIDPSDNNTDFSDNSNDSSVDSGPVVSRRTMSVSADAMALNDENTPDVIKLLVVYTPAAAAWARTNETNIANTISLMMDRAELALSNSNTLLTLELVHSAQVSYTEVNSVNDLYNLQGAQDGFMDNVHCLRDYHAADLVVLLADVNYTGGQGFLLTSTAGQPAYGFSLTRIQQASGTYTTIHEIAHNLGCHHHKQQNTQPGPGIFSYSAGWRWNGTNNSRYCSIMTYEAGSYFSDGISHTRVPYFSSPNIQYSSGITGNAADGDNARTIRQTKTAVSSYRTEQPAVRVLSPNGGEKLLAGSTHRIRWTVSSHIDNCVLAYSLNGGYTFTTITTLNGSNTSYDWTVPNTPSIQCRLRITGSDNSGTFSVSDVSDFNFEIATVITDPCSDITSIAGCGPANTHSFTGGGSGLWFSHSGNPCGYFSPGVEKIYSFTAPETGNYSLQVTDATGYVDYLWKTGSCSPEGWHCFADVSQPGRHGSVTWTKGTTYYILLDFENSFPTTHTFYIDYPESVNNIAGNTEVYNLISNLNYRRAIPVTFSEAGTVYSLSVYHEGGRGNMLMAVYSNSSGTPGSRLGVTASTPVNSSAGWQTVSLENPVPVNAGETVWLSWVFEHTVGVRHTSGSPARAQSGESWSGGMPQSFGTASLGNYRYSVYCSYTPGVVSGNTLGNTEVYDLISNLNYRRAIQVTFPEGGTIQSLSICHEGGNGNMLMAVYSNSSGTPGSRLGITSSTPVNSSAGWQTISLENPVTVSPGQTVWLSWIFQNKVGVRHTSGSPARAQSGASWSGGMPQDFGTASLDNYRYSVYCSYTPEVSTSKILGNTEIYDLISNHNYRRAIQVTFPEAGTIESLSICHAGGRGNMLMAVYSNSSGAPGSRLGVTSSVAVNSSAGWQTVPLVSPVTVSPGQTVWLSWVFENTVGVRHTGGSPARAQSGASWSGGMPQSFGTASLGNYRYSVYCNYTPGSTSTKLLGNTDIYELVSNLNYRRAIPVTFTEVGTIQSLSICHSGGNGNMLMGVYSNSSGTPGSRLGVTSSVAVNSSAGWQTVSLVNPVTVSAGQTVWLSWVFQNSVGVRHTKTPPARAQSGASWSGGMPQSFGTASLADFRYSVYCSYTVPGSDETIPADEADNTVSDLFTMEKEQVLIYPNPTDGEFTVSWKNIYDYRLTITIYGVSGQLIKTVQTDPGINEIILNLNGMMKGIYFIELKDRKNDIILSRSGIIKK